MQCGDCWCMTPLLICASHRALLTLSTGVGRGRINLLTLFPTGVKPHSDKHTHTPPQAPEDVWWQTIMWHLTVGVPSLAFHPSPWTERFSCRGQPSINSHQSHMHNKPFHFLQPLPAPCIHHYSLPFYWHLWKHKDSLSLSLSVPLPYRNTHTRYSSSFVLCGTVMYRSTLGDDMLSLASACAGNMTWRDFKNVIYSSLVVHPMYREGYGDFS